MLIQVLVLQGEELLLNAGSNPEMGTSNNPREIASEYMLGVALVWYQKISGDVFFRKLAHIQVLQNFWLQQLNTEDIGHK